MSKKEFNQINTDPVFDAISNATAEPAPEPKKKRSDNRETISLVIDKQASEYMRTMANMLNISYSSFINTLLHDHEKRNADLYEKAKEAQRITRELLNSF